MPASESVMGLVHLLSNTAKQQDTWPQPERALGESERDLGRGLCFPILSCGYPEQKVFTPSSNMERRASETCVFWPGDSFAFLFPDPVLLHYPNATFWEGI